MDATVTPFTRLPAGAARLLAVETLLADPEALGDDVLESCLYLLRDRLRSAASGYRGSFMALRMAVLIRMRERGLTAEELADLTGMTPAAVLETGLHSPTERERLAVVLGWPPDYFGKASAGGPGGP
jgi:hypothetical protein